MKNLIRLFSIPVIGILLSACANDRNEPIVPQVKQNVSFRLDIQPILTQYCARCHNGGMMNIQPDLREGKAIKSLMGMEGSIIPGDANGSELMGMLQGGGDNPMPPNATMTPLNIALIQQWINEGALNN